MRVEKLLASPIHSIAPLLPSYKASDPSPVNHLVGRFYIITFTDGSVGVYDIEKYEFVYLRQGGHTETIFCCDFKPSLAKSDQPFAVFATGSYDGTLKIWDLHHSTNLPVTQVSGQSAGAAGMSANSTGERFRCAMNGLWVGKNLLPQSFSKAKESSQSVDVTLIDSFPPLGAGRTNDEGLMHTEYGIWYSISWSHDQSYRFVTVVPYTIDFMLVDFLDSLQAPVVGMF